MMRAWHSRIWLDGIPIAAGADLGITEDPQDTQKLTPWRDINGWLHTRGPRKVRHRRQLEIELACEDRWGPAIDTLELGFRTLFHSSKHEASRIPAGQTSVTLSRFPVPDATKPWGYAVIAHRVDDDGGKRVPVTVIGRTVTIDEAHDVAIVVQFLPIRPIEVTEIIRGKATEIQGRQSWGLRLREIRVPAGWTPGDPLPQSDIFP